MTDDELDRLERQVDAWEDAMTEIERRSRAMVEAMRHWQDVPRLDGG